MKNGTYVFVGINEIFRVLIETFKQYIEMIYSGKFLRFCIRPWKTLTQLN